MERKIDYEALPDYIKKWDFLDIVEKKCTAYELNPYHILAVIACESNGNPLAIRYEPEFKYVYEVESFAKMLNASISTIIAMQRTSFGLGQVMGTRFFELGGTLEAHPHFRWPTSMLRPNTGIEYTCRTWKECSKRHSSPNDIYCIYNAGSIRYSTIRPDEFVNQSAVDRFMRHLNSITKTVRY